MKCATDRKKDIIDAKNIIEAKEINWNILIKEAKLQIRLGIEDAAFELGNFLEKLHQMKVAVPKKVLDELFEIVKSQAEKKLG
ncbi:MAG: hypothetical protein U9Q69_01835 [Nanoarchaeota archaeon]|nr:hypothetical protein [Nanoarchaeota archaeon]